MEEDFEVLFTDEVGDDFDFSDPVEKEDIQVDESTEEDKDPKEEDKIDEEDFDFEGEEPVESNDDGTPPKKETSLFISKLESLGLTEGLDFKDEEGNDIDLSKLSKEEESEVLQDVIQASANKSVETLLGKLPPNLRDLNKFVMDGGSMESYISNIDSSKVDFYDYEELPEDKMEAFLNKEFAELGYDAEDTQAQIKSLKDSGKLNSFSEKRFSSWKDKEKGGRDDIKTANKERANRALEEDKKFINNINTLLDTNNISGVKINRAKAEELKDYMTKPVLGEDKRKMPQVHRDILKAIQDPNKLAVLALLSNNDFNLEEIGKQFSTKGKKEIVKKINSQKPKFVSVSDLF